MRTQTLKDVTSTMIQTMMNGLEAARSQISHSKKDQKRHKEHEQAALLTTSTDIASLFYSSSPSSTSAHVKLCITRKGYFNDLVQFVGVGFNRQKDNVVTYLINCINAGDGVFAFDAATKNKCVKVNF
jgi:hypothetical protein